MRSHESLHLFTYGNGIFFAMVATFMALLVVSCCTCAWFVKERFRASAQVAPSPAVQAWDAWILHYR